jgi:hypothetical protein
MPALLKWGLVLIVPDAILDVYLTVNFGVVWTSILDLVFGVLPFADLPVYGCFLDLGCWLGPLFRPVLVPLLDRVFRHSKTRLCFLPHKNSLDVCLHIRNKSPHPVRVRFLGKGIKSEKLEFMDRGYPPRSPFLLIRSPF